MFSAASCPSLKIVYNLRERTYYLTLGYLHMAMLLSNKTLSIETSINCVFMFYCYFVSIVYSSLDDLYNINFYVLFYTLFHDACASVICVLKYLLTQ